MKKSIALFTFVVLALFMTQDVSLAVKEGAPDCKINRGLCSRTIGEKTVVLDVNPKPVRTMEELVFRLSIKPDPLSPPEVVIDLSMPGMYMGKNRVVLKKSPDGTYSGKGVIPKCRRGRRLWKAAVDIPRTGKVDFTFNVSD